MLCQRVCGTRSHRGRGLAERDQVNAGAEVERIGREPGADGVARAGKRRRALDRRPIESDSESAGW
jgi:hypothetical protein